MAISKTYEIIVELRYEISNETSLRLNHIKISYSKTIHILEIASINL